MPGAADGEPPLDRPGRVRLEVCRRRRFRLARMIGLAMKEKTHSQRIRKSTTKPEQHSQNAAEPVWVGLDVSKATLAVNAGTGFEGSIDNTRKDIGHLTRTLAKSCPAGRGLRFCMEHTGPFADDVWSVLDDLGQEVCMLDAAKVRHYAKACGIAAKTDPVDAAVIRAYAEQTRPEPTPRPSAERLALRELSATREFLVRQRAKVKQRLDACRNPICQKTLRQEIRSLDIRIAGLDKEMAKLVASDPELKALCEALQAIPCVGQVTATLIVALVPELGTLGRRRAASLAGLAPHPRESGLWCGRRKTGGGRRSVRTALYMAALTATRFHPELKRFYERLSEAGKPFRVALVAVMRKLFVRMDAVAARARKTLAES